MRAPKGDHLNSATIRAFTRSSAASTPCAARRLKRAGKKAGLPFQVHAHMIRHATGYQLANTGKDTRSIQGYLGHKDTAHGALRRAVTDRFKNFWPD